LAQATDADQPALLALAAADLSYYRPRMKRATALAGGFGLANAIVAVAVVTLLPRGSHDTGWFAYAPLAESKPAPSNMAQMDWAFVALPVALIALNFVLVLAATRKRWMHN